MDNEIITSTEQSRIRSLIMSFIFVIVIVGGFVIVCLCKYGNTPQVYTDIVLESLGTDFTNKSIELRIFWLGLLIGLGILAFSYSWIKRRTVGQYHNEFVRKDNILFALFIVAILSGQLLFWGYFNYILIGALLVFAIAKILDFEIAQEICLYFLLIYGLAGIYRVYVFLGGAHSIDSNLLFASAVCIYILIKLLKLNTNRMCVISQIAIPFLFLIYLVDDYIAQGECYVLRQRKIVYILIFGLIILALLELAIIARNNWSNCTTSVGTINTIAIMAFNRFSGNGFVMLTDMHHPAENTIAYNEISNLGRSVFSEYVPVSGLYSWVQGLFLNIFGDGNYTEYSNANNVFYLFICILTVFALREHLNSIIVLLVSSCIYISDYSRVALILPFMLFLLSKRIINKPDVWYMLWVILGWCYGLYYPAYGVGIIVSMLPLAIYQMGPFIKEWKAKEARQKIITIISYAILLLTILISTPLLIGTAEHVIDMGDGMLYVDGVTIFGQALPSDFLEYLNVEGSLYTLRLILGYVIRFTGPMLVVWIAFAAVINIYKNREPYGKKIYCLNVEECSILSCLIFPIICFYFSLYRMGGNNLFNRAIYIIDFSLILIAIVLYNYGKDKTSLALITMAVFFCTIGNINGLNEIDSKLYGTYNVPDDYVYVDYDIAGAPNLGKGFIQQDQLNQIQSAAQRFQTLDQDRNYFALFSNGDHGMAYDEILNIKGTGMLESLVVRGYSISKDTAEKLKKCSTIVGNRISPVDHYYLWKWLVSSGEYVWNNDEGLFYPANGEEDAAIREKNALAVAGLVTTDCGRYAASLGNSLDPLQDVLTTRDLNTQIESTDDGATLINFADSIQGNDVDYMYLQLATDDDYKAYILGTDYVASNKLENLLLKHEYNEALNVIVQWKANDGSINQISSKVENGKLLIPIGAGIKWLSNEHSYVKIWCENNGEIIEIPEIEDIQFYKVRDIVIEE